MLATEKYAVAEAINICEPVPVPISDVVEMLLDICDFSPKVVYNSDKPSTIPYKVSDPSLARELLGWLPLYSLKEGLSKTVNWYEEHVY